MTKKTTKAQTVKVNKGKPKVKSKVAKKNILIREWSITLAIVLFAIALGLLAVVGYMVYQDAQDGGKKLDAVKKNLTGDTAIHVPGDADTIEEAIELAPEGAVIKLDEGTYTTKSDLNGVTAGIIVDKALTIQGAGRDKTILDGGDDIMHGVYVPTTEAKIVIEDMTIENFSNNGVEILGNNVELSGLTIRENGNRGASFRFNKKTVLFHNNVVVQNRFNGIATEKSAVRIYNNTLVENGPTGISIVVADTDPSGTSPEIYNNIIIGHSDFGIFYDHPAFVGKVIVDHNNLHNNGQNYWEELNNEGLKAEAVNPVPGTGERHVDPKFANETNYTLTSDSPLLTLSRSKGEMGAYGMPEAIQEFDLNAKE